MGEDTSDAQVHILVERCREGDQSAAASLFNRYVHQLIVLVRGRMSQRVARRIDPDDVVQSAYSSFFCGLGNGKFTIDTTDELWGLLATITLHKLYRRLAYHSAERRSVHRECQPAQDGSVIVNHPELVADLPSPSHAMEVVEELEQVNKYLTYQERKVLALRLEGCSSEEIANRLGRSVRTVRRAMEKVRAEFERRLAETSQ